MAKKKLLKLPKKPKANASVATKEAYLAKIQEISKKNEEIIRANKKSEELTKKIDQAIKAFNDKMRRK